MKCPVCGYVDDSKDMVCIACGADIAFAKESSAMEKRRSEEAMERYHEQQKELRRELGLEEPEEEPLFMEWIAENGSSPSEDGSGEDPLELEEIPSDFYANAVLCPRCGFRNGGGADECARCGVIFSKLKNAMVDGGGDIVGSQGRDIVIDPAGTVHDSIPSGPNPSSGNEEEGLADDFGEYPIGTGSGYNPYVHEAKTEPWAGAKAMGRRVKEAWRAADFPGKGEASRQEGLRLWQWLKGRNPRWFGAFLGVALVLASLPFAWKGGVFLMSDWEQRSRAKGEAKLVEEFFRDNNAIRAEIRALANEEKFDEARAALARFDIPPLKEKITDLEQYLEEKETYARVLTVPAWKFEANYSLFTRLVELDPSSSFYRAKQEFYKKRLADQCYEKALSYYRGQKSDAAESDKAVHLIEKAVGFYPDNRAYKELRSKLIQADLLFYKGNASLQMALRDEGRGKAAYEKQRKITVWLRNTSGDSLYINPDFFTLETTNGKSLKFNNMMETGLKGKLAPGEKTAGTLYFRTLAMPRRLIFEHLVAGAVQREFP